MGGCKGDLGVKFTLYLQETYNVRMAITGEIMQIIVPVYSNAVILILCIACINISNLSEYYNW